MKDLIGTEKQVKWATDIRNQYLKLCESYNISPVDCEDSKFWIEYGQVTNITVSNLKNYLIAYTWLKDGLTEDQMYDLAESDEEKYADALNLISRGFVK